ncbi:unnamed protein product [Effrenium voratum]|uniref:Uncharacterized protein n=1 Tax=Effrenium voratum TaxID=2562239 RepID=A0AA36NHL0_9DINO|nr:unnamed protein product [Effrenium voratum]
MSLQETKEEGGRLHRFDSLKRPGGPWKREPNGRGVGELLPSSRWQYHVLPGGGAVRLRWEKAAGRWKLWAEAGERLVLEATFESPEPQLELYTESTYVASPAWAC